MEKIKNPAVYQPGFDVLKCNFLRHYKRHAIILFWRLVSRA